MSHPTNNWRQWRIEHRLYAGIVKTAFSKLSVFIFWSKTAKIGGFTLLFYCSIEFVKIDFQCIHIYLVCSLYDDWHVLYVYMKLYILTIAEHLEQWFLTYPLRFDDVFSVNVSNNSIYSS